ncbi:FecR family protein [Ovoidimarina sediminis]|uniref:FecR family protein n=1 Tax=Ovoidimarina sediminis TaxID=3079856 RepID=UPI002914163E|nr:FecR domain-containing protein [Rhodophyticola sp. MJ-SS7]MDU8943262.1 FecR domain-containing protein [Rhodophyticola sp. MJ-SS7]
MKTSVMTIAAAAIAAFGATSAPAVDIGVVASLDPNLRGTPPGASQRRLTIGTDVVQNEEIVSSATGRGQLLFLDETTLSLAPSSRIVLDTFVYDPAKKDGSIGMRLTEGALRFIGGQTTKNREGLIRTPAATIGIRGSSAIVMHENGKTRAVFLAGDRMCMTSDSGGRTCTTRTGAVLDENGFAGRIDPNSLVSLIERIDGTPPAQLARTGTLGGGQGGGQSAMVSDGVAPGDAPVSTSGAVVQAGLFDDKIGSDRSVMNNSDVGGVGKGNCGVGSGSGGQRDDCKPKGNR